MNRNSFCPFTKYRIVNQNDSFSHSNSDSNCRLMKAAKESESRFFHYPNRHSSRLSSSFWSIHGRVLHSRSMNPLEWIMAFSQIARSHCRLQSDMLRLSRGRHQNATAERSNGRKNNRLESTPTDTRRDQRLLPSLSQKCEAGMHLPA